MGSPDQLVPHAHRVMPERYTVYCNGTTMSRQLLAFSGDTCHRGVEARFMVMEKGTNVSSGAAWLSVTPVDQVHRGPYRSWGSGEIGPDLIRPLSCVRSLKQHIRRL